MNQDLIFDNSKRFLFFYKVSILNMKPAQFPVQRGLNSRGMKLYHRFRICHHSALHVERRDSSLNTPRDSSLNTPLFKWGMLTEIRIILFNDQRNAQFFYIYLFQFSTCFEHSSAHHQEIQMYQYDIWYMSLCR